MALVCTRRTFLKSSGVAGAAAMMGFTEAGDHVLRPLRTAWLGFGEAARRHFDAGLAAGLLDPVSVSDPVCSAAKDAVVASRVAGLRSPKVHPSWERLFLGRRAELTVVASPDHWHLEQALAAVQAGSHVLLETMPTRTWEGFQLLQERARRGGRLVAVAAPWRMSKGMQLARQAIASGELGPLEEVRVEGRVETLARTGLREPEDGGESVDWGQWLGGAEWPEARREALLDRGWRRFRQFGSGVFSGEAFRRLDEALWMTGDPGLREVSALGGRRRGVRSRPGVGAVGAPMDCVAVGRLTNGGSFRLDVRSRLPVAVGEPVAMGVIRGRRGSVVWGAGGTVSLVHEDPTRSWSVPGLGETPGRQALWVDVASAVQRGVTSEVGLESFAPTMASALAILGAMTCQTGA